MQGTATRDRRRGRYMAPAIAARSARRRTRALAPADAKLGEEARQPDIGVSADGDSSIEWNPASCNAATTMPEQTFSAAAGLGSRAPCPRSAA